MQKSATKHSVGAIMTSILGSIPWCCIVPASLSLLSLTGVLFSQVWLTKLTWIFLPLSAAFLGRAFWLIYIRHEGLWWTRWLTWGALVIAVGFWSPRVWLSVRY